MPACAIVAIFPESPDTVHAGELEIRLGEGLVLASGRALTLSVREFELLAAMARRLGAIITREELYASVWRGALRPGDRSVDVYVSKLRSKLEAALPDRRFIHTHQGFGYRFQPEAARSAGGAGDEPGRPDDAPGGAGDAPDGAGESPSAAADAPPVGANAGARTGAALNGTNAGSGDGPSRDVHIGVSDG